ncbi:hypothetical protein AYK26_02190 [Euryarchaeota archaeon SM23-78]|nr:MAG: hypothetical protein AYK26_02190 [Euryarchaeota archaeon SM23-78]MBW3000909.1 hypothetical protein [Candidatus Woesearchaeota archaeon]
MAYKIGKQEVDKIVSGLSNENMVVELFKDKIKNHVVLLKKADTKIGAAERHVYASEIYYVLKGKAKLNIGGKIVEEKQVGEGEFKSPKAEGYETHDMKEEDFFYITKNEVHQLDARQGLVVYLIIKIFSNE